MLVVAAIELRHPMVLIIQVKTHDVTREAFHIAIARQTYLMPHCGSPQGPRPAETVIRLPLSHPDALPGTVGSISSNALMECANAAPARISAATQIASMICSPVAPARLAALTWPSMHQGHWVT